MFTKSVSALVLGSCNDALGTFLAACGFSGEPEAPSVSGKPGQTISYTKRAAMRAQCRKLTKFLRLVDFLVTEAFHSIALSSVEHLLAHSSYSRQPEASHASPLFNVEIVMPTSEGPGASLEFSPGETDLLAQLEHTVFNGLMMINSPPKLLREASFEMFVRTGADENLTHDAQPLEAMIMQDRHFQDIFEQLNACVQTAYADANVYATRFSRCARTYAENVSFMRCMTPEIMKAKSTDELREYFELYTKQIAEFKDLRESEHIGVVSINTSALISLVRPTANACLLLLHQLLPNIYDARSDIVLAELSQLNDQVSSSPKTVVEFVRLAKALEQTKERLDEIHTDSVLISETYHLMSVFSVKIPDATRTKAGTINTIQHQLTASIHRAEDFLEVNKSRFVHDLADMVHNMQIPLESARNRLSVAMLQNPEADVPSVLDHLSECSAALEEIHADSARLVEFQEVLKVHLFDGNDLAALMLDAKHKSHLWTKIQEWQLAMETWVNLPIHSLDPVTLKSQVESFEEAISGSVAVLPESAPALKFQGALRDFAVSIPVVSDLLFPSLRERHFSMLESVVGCDDFSTVTFGEVLDKKPVQFADAVSSIKTQACEEEALSNKFGAIQSTWDDTCLEFCTLEGSDVPLVSNGQEIAALIEDAEIELDAIVLSPNSEPIRIEALELSGCIATLSKTFREWLDFQSAWARIHAVASNPGQRRENAAAEEQHLAIDTWWRQLLSEAQNEPNCLKVASVPGLCQSIAHNREKTDEIMRGFRELLEGKRRSFARFCFMNDAELLHAIGQNPAPHDVNTFISKLFPAVASCDLGETVASTVILALVSANGERLSVGPHLKMRGDLEDWAGALEDSMRRNIHKLCKVSVSTIRDAEWGQWLFSQPAQCISVAAQIFCAQECEAAFASNSNEGTLQGKAKLLIGLLQTALGPRSRTHASNILIMCTHFRDLQESAAMRNSDFEWKAQMRTYWDRHVDGVMFCQNGIELKYGNEFTDLTSRLVVTPSTVRCWLAMTTAFRFQMGADCHGQGKTAVVLELAAWLGRVPLLVHCGKTLTTDSMERMLLGAASLGAWLVLKDTDQGGADFFSQLRNLLYPMRCARRANLSTMTFYGEEVQYKDYQILLASHRTQLGSGSFRESVSTEFFRPVWVPSPDPQRLAQLHLYGQGFAHAEALAPGVVAFFDAARDSSPFFAAAGKGIGHLCSNAMSAEVARSVESEVAQIASNVRTYVLAGMATSREHEAVQRLFTTALGHEWPAEHAAQTIEPSGMPRDISNVHAAMQSGPDAVVILGPAGAGKTALLERVRNMEASKPAGFAVSPKALGVSGTFGSFDAVRRVWKDGLLTTKIRELSRSQTGAWIVIDGPISSDWAVFLPRAGDMNLGDGGHVTVPAGLGVQFFVETASLTHASPTSAWNFRIVWVEKSWSMKEFAMQKMCAAQVSLNAEEEEYLGRLVNEFWEPLKTHACSDRPPHFALQLDCSFCSLLTATLAAPHSEFCDSSERQAQLCQSCVFSAIWAIRPTVSVSSQIGALEGLISETASKAGLVADLPLGFVDKPFDWFFTGKAWEPWVSTRSPMSFSDCLISRDADKCARVVQLHIQSNQSVMIQGGGMTCANGAKRLSMDFLETAKHFKYTHLVFSARTNPSLLARSLQALPRLDNDTLGEGPGCAHVFFIDDFNLPGSGDPEASSAHELIRQIQSSGGYSSMGRQEFTQHSWKTILRASFVATSSRSPFQAELSPRLLWRFSLCEMSQVHSQAVDLGPLDSIQTTFLDAALGLCWRMQELVQPSPSTPHYSFGLTHVHAVAQSMQRFTRANAANAVTDEMWQYWMDEAMHVFTCGMASAKDALAVATEVANLGHGDVDKLYHQRTWCADLSNPSLSAFEDCLKKRLPELDPEVSVVGLSAIVEDLARLSRALGEAGSSAVLLGSLGSGRNRLLQLCALLHGLSVSSFDQRGSVIGIKEAILASGIDCEPVLLNMNLSEADGVAYEFAQNLLLRRANFGAFFEDFEMQKAYYELGAKKTTVNPRDEFLRNVGANLRIVLSVTTHAALQEIVRAYPSLLDRPTWIRLGTVTQSRLVRATSQYDLGVSAEAFVSVFMDVARFSNVEPCSQLFLSFVESYRQRRDELQKGLQLLKDKLVVAQNNYGHAVQEAARLRTKIEASCIGFDVKEEIGSVKTAERKVAEEQAELASLTETSERDADAAHALREEVLSYLNKADATKIHGLVPSDTLDFLTQCICALDGATWTNAQSVVASPGLLLGALRGAISSAPSKRFMDLFGAQGDALGKAAQGSEEEQQLHRTIHCIHEVALKSHHSGRLAEVTEKFDKAVLSLSERRGLLAHKVSLNSNLNSELAKDTAILTRLEKILSATDNESHRWSRKLAAGSVAESSAVGDAILSTVKCTFLGSFLGADRPNVYRFAKECLGRHTIMASPRLFHSSYLDEKDLVLKCPSPRYIIDVHNRCRPWIESHAGSSLPEYVAHADGSFSPQYDFLAPKSGVFLTQGFGIPVNFAQVLLQEGCSQDFYFLASRMALTPEWEPLVRVIDLSLGGAALEARIRLELEKAVEPSVSEERGHVDLRVASLGSSLSEMEDRFIGLWEGTNESCYDDESSLAVLVDVQESTSRTRRELRAANARLAELNSGLGRYLRSAGRFSAIYRVMQTLVRTNRTYTFPLDMLEHKLHAEMPSHRNEAPLALAATVTEWLCKLATRGILRKHRLPFLCSVMSADGSSGGGGGGDLQESRHAVDQHFPFECLGDGPSLREDIMSVSAHTPLLLVSKETGLADRIVRLAGELEQDVVVSSPHNFQFPPAKEAEQIWYVFETAWNQPWQDAFVAEAEARLSNNRSSGGSFRILFVAQDFPRCSQPLLRTCMRSCCEARPAMAVQSLVEQVGNAQDAHAASSPTLVALSKLHLWYQVIHGSFLPLQHVLTCLDIVGASQGTEALQAAAATAYAELLVGRGGPNVAELLAGPCSAEAEDADWEAAVAVSGEWVANLDRLRVWGAT